MKTKKILITVIVILLSLATIFTTLFFVREDTENKTQQKNESVTEVSSKIESEEINVEKVESEIVSSEEKFIEPDETKADELLKEHSSKKEATVSSEAEEKKPTESKTESVATDTISKPVVAKPQKEKEKKKQTTSTSSKKETVKTESKKTESKKEDNKIQTFEEGKKELENTANDYLKKHNIDQKTAGETGELCPNCSKKIWNPDKYGFCIPGMPEDYEKSGYCLGTCGITLE